MSNQLVNYNEEWAAFANQFANQVPVTSNAKTLSLRGGVFSQGDEQLGTMLCTIILDSVAVNTYFEGRWEEGAKDTPKCYAFGFPPEEMRPHVESMRLHMDHFYPQTLNPATGEIGACSTCPKNQFGSADTGKGKACQNRDRLALIPAGMFVQQRSGYGYDLHLFDDPNHFATTPLSKLNLPVTSVRNFREYAQRTINETRRPPWGVITVIELAPHPKFQTEVKFHMKELVPDYLFPVIRERYLAAHEGMIEPYSPPKVEDAPPQQQRTVVMPPTAHGLTGFGRR